MPSLDSSIISIIFNKLDVKDVLHCACVDTQWRAVALEDSRWKHYCDAHLNVQERIGEYPTQLASMYSPIMVLLSLRTDVFQQFIAPAPGIEPATSMIPHRINGQKTCVNSEA